MFMTHANLVTNQNLCKQNRTLLNANQSLKDENDVAVNKLYKNQQKILKLKLTISETNKINKELTTTNEQSVRAKGHAIVNAKNLSVDNKKFVKANKQLTVEKNQLTVEKNQLTVEKGQLTVEKGQLTVEKNQLTVTNQQLESESLGNVWRGLMNTALAIGDYAKKVFHFITFGFFKS